MKTKPIIYLGTLVALIITAIWITEMSAVERAPAPEVIAIDKADYPINKRCVVTVDPHMPKPVVAGQTNVVTGFAAPDTVEGILIQVDHEWLVLRDGSDENWISRHKVVMIHTHD